MVVDLPNFPVVWSLTSLSVDSCIGLGNTPFFYYVLLTFSFLSKI